MNALLRRDFHEDRAFATGSPLLGDEAAVRQLLLHPLGVGIGFIDLVDSHDDRHVGGPGVVNGFQGLGHHAVVGGHHDDDNIRHLGAAGSHAREGFVARGIEEDDLAARSRRAFLAEAHFVSADVLRDAARLACRHVGFADGVEQRGLAVIHVAHDRDHRRAGNLQLASVLGFQNFFDGLVGDLLFVADHRGAGAELGGDILHHLCVQRLVDSDKDATHEQDGDQILGANFELFSKILDADALRDRDFAGNGQRVRAEICRSAKTRRWHKALHRAFLGLRILRASAAASGSRALRARSLAGRRGAACAGACTKAGTGCAKARTRAKAWACSRSSGSGIATRCRACGMLGARPAG